MEFIKVKCFVIILLLSTLSIKAQNNEDVFRTSETFYNTTFVGFDLLKPKDIFIEILNVEGTEIYFEKEIKGEKKVGFKIYLPDLPKGKYIMMFKNNKREVLKSFKINKVK